MINYSIIKISPSLDTDNDKYLDQLLRIYYENYLKQYGFKKLEELISYEMKLYGEKYEFLNKGNLKKCLNNEDNFLFVCLDQSEVVGFIYFKKLSNYFLLEEIHSKYKGRGIGSKLLEFFESFAKNQGYKKVLLESNENAKNFYLKKGYKLIKKDNEGYYLMEKNI